MRMTFLSVLAAAMAMGLPAPTQAEFRGEVEHARANARAGGPVSEYDYELLERWGHVSDIQPRYRRAYVKRRYYEDAPYRRWHR